MRSASGSKGRRLSRRRFLRRAGAGAASLAALAGRAPAALEGPSPNESLGTGHIGLGVRGGNVIYQVAGGRHWSPARGARVAAICDVYGPHRKKGLERGANPAAKAYLDYHDLLADKAVDAVVIAIPDHAHSRVVIDAARAGKHVYCEKGWTRSIPEAKAMREAVKKSGIVMQLGHQGRSRTAGAQAAELIREGILGPVTLVRTGRLINAPVGKAIWRWYGEYRNYTRPDPKKVRAELDWERWLGALSWRPFSMEHFWHWRCYWDYGTGVAGDLLSHEIDFVQAVLGHGIPDTCSTLALNTLLRDGRDVPDTWQTTYGFEKARRVVTFASSMNGSEPIQPPEFRGKEASLRFDSIAQSVSTFDVVAESTSRKYEKELSSGKIERGKPFLKFDPAKTPELPNHMQDFIDSVHAGRRPRCHVGEAFVEAATIIMAVESLRRGRVVRWDREKEEIV